MVGEAADAVAARVKLEVAGVIVLEGLSPPVCGIPVGLDDQAVLTPQEIDGVPTDAYIHFGSSKPVPATKRHDGALEFATRMVAFDLAEVQTQELGLA